MGDFITGLSKLDKLISDMKKQLQAVKNEEYLEIEDMVYNEEWKVFRNKAKELHELVQVLNSLTVSQSPSRTSDQSRSYQTPVKNRSAARTSDRSDHSDPLKMTISPNSSSPKRKISKDKYKIEDVKGDGNCMFRAIALGMKRVNDEKKAKSHSTIRNIATKWIEDHIEWSEIRQIQTATDGRTFKRAS